MYTSKNASTLVALLITLLEFICLTCLVYLVAFTFGASLIENFYETTLFSMLISLECFMPILICIEHASPFDWLNRLFIQKEFRSKLEANLVNVAFGAVIGAWCGALVIPLDWDRWWQEWPLSCCFGSLVGSLFGGVFNSFSFRNKIKLHL